MARTFASRAPVVVPGWATVTIVLRHGHALRLAQVIRVSMPRLARRIKRVAKAAARRNGTVR